MGSGTKRRRCMLALMCLVAAGCGGAMSAREAPSEAATGSGGGSADSGGYAAYRPMSEAPPPAPPGDVSATSLETLSVRGDSGGADEDMEVSLAPEPERQVVATSRTSGEFREPGPTVAQAQPQQQQQTGGGGQAQQQTATDATDGSGPLLIYEAELYLAVNEVRQRQQDAIAAVREMGGFVARQDDTTVVLRVPARRFNDALGALERIGDVLHRTVQSHDVTEEFHDVEVRLRNAMAVRDRLQQLLERAGNVQDSLVVERELERVTLLIEQMRGRLRFLSDRISFSTITLHFQGRPTETLGPASAQFRLPFRWLDQLGLSNLLDLSAAE